MAGSYLKSRDFPIHALAAWWALWLAASQSELNEFLRPSPAALAQFATLIGAFLVGHWLIRYQAALGLRIAQPKSRLFRVGTPRMRLALQGSAIVSALLLLAGLRLSGALSDDFIAYFARLRLDEGGVDGLTGIKTLDVLTKIFAFPMSYTVILVILATDARHFRFALLLCIFNLLCFSYLWQVNYPLIHLFWFLVFHSLIQAHRKGHFDSRVTVVMVAVFSILLASAANRFGGDVLGGLQRYIVGYHLIGFSFYDHQLQDPNSILHTHTYGRSSLGFLDQMLEAAAKVVGISYQAASFENSDFNNQAVDIGLSEVREFNAFGTFLFSLYRDFHIVGILAGGFLYGAVTTHALYSSGRNWLCGALFLVLAAAWMMGMMVNPLEQAYFWFAIVALGLLALVNKGLRW